MIGFLSSPGESEMLVIVAIIGLLVLMLIPTIFYLLTLQKALARCSAECRTLSPGLVWLQLVPLLNIVWVFILVINIAKSLGNEFRRRGIVESPNPGQSVGMAMAICSVVSIVPFIGSLASIAALVCWIVYWVQIAKFSALIAEPMPVAQVPGM